MIEASPRTPLRGRKRGEQKETVVKCRAFCRLGKKEREKKKKKRSRSADE